MRVCMTEPIAEVEPAPRKAPVPHRIVDLVTAHINQKLGQVPGHVVTKSIPLWDNHWRVNVFVRENSDGLIDNIRIRHSFFVTTDKLGVIIGCSADGDKPRKLWKEVT